MKHIKYFEKFNESLLTFVTGTLLSLFIYNLIKRRKISKNSDEISKKMIEDLLDSLKNYPNVKSQVTDYNDRYFIRMERTKSSFWDIRLMKKEKVLLLYVSEIKGQFKFKLSDKEYDDFIEVLNK